jgi:hypothetical protein
VMRLVQHWALAGERTPSPTASAIEAAHLAETWHRCAISRSPASMRRARRASDAVPASHREQRRPSHRPAGPERPRPAFGRCQERGRHRRDGLPGIRLHARSFSRSDGDGLEAGRHLGVGRVTRHRASAGRSRRCPEPQQVTLLSSSATRLRLEMGYPDLSLLPGPTWPARIAQRRQQDCPASLRHAVACSAGGDGSGRRR